MNSLFSTSSRSQSTAVTPSSTSAATRLSSSQVPTTPTTPSVTTAASPVTTPTTPAALAPSAGATSPTQPIQLSDLQNILATMNVPAAGQGGEGLTSVFIALGLLLRCLVPGITDFLHGFCSHCQSLLFYSFCL